MNAAQIIQRKIRSHFTKQRWERNIYPALVQLNAVGAGLVDNIINQLLEDEIVPELLMDVLAAPSGHDDPYRIGTLEDRVAAEYWYEISKDVIFQESRKVASKVMNEMVTTFLNKASIKRSKTGPFAEVALSLIDHDVVPIMLREVVSESVSELVHEYVVFELIFFFAFVFFCLMFAVFCFFLSFFSHLISSSRPFDSCQKKKIHFRESL